MSAFFGRYAFSIGLAIVVSGCGGYQESIPQNSPTNGVISRSFERDDSWIVPEAKSQTLLYVSAAPNDVFVYTYPRPKLVGELRFNGEVAGLCSDQDGNVWVPVFNPATSKGKIFEYKHGSKRRIAALRDDGAPSGCARDPLSGNLAVTNSCVTASCPSDGGDVVIYAAGSGTGTSYIDPSITDYDFCTYDDSGDLFVDGQGPLSSFALAELPRNQTNLSDVRIDQDLTTPAGLAWYGKHLAISSGSAIYEYSLRHGKANQVHATSLNDTSDAGQFALLGKIAVVPGAQSNNVAFYHYPAGGSPTTMILLFQTISAALSLPPAH